MYSGELDSSNSPVDKFRNLPGNNLRLLDMRILRAVRNASDRIFLLTAEGSGQQAFLHAAVGTIQPVEKGHWALYLIDFHISIIGFLDRSDFR